MGRGGGGGRRYMYFVFNIHRRIYRLYIYSTYRFNRGMRYGETFKRMKVKFNKLTRVQSSWGFFCESCEAKYACSLIWINAYFLIIDFRFSKNTVVSWWTEYGDEYEKSWFFRIYNFWILNEWNNERANNLKMLCTDYSKCHFIRLILMNFTFPCN